MLDKRGKFLVFLISLLSFQAVAQQPCDIIYVAPSVGNATGFADDPTNLIHAMTLVTGSRTHLRLLEGTYNISTIINISNNMTIEGGFREDGNGIWVKRSDATTTLNMSGFETIVIGSPYNVTVGQYIGFKAQNANGWFIGDVTINIVNATGTTGNRGRSVYGIYINNCTGYSLSRCIINPGDGTDGADGAGGTVGYNPGSDPYDGLGGSNGVTGGGGHCDDENLNDANYSGSFGIGYNGHGGQGGAGGGTGGGAGAPQVLFGCCGAGSNGGSGDDGSQYRAGGGGGAGGEGGSEQNGDGGNGGMGGDGGGGSTSGSIGTGGGQNNITCCLLLNCDVGLDGNAGNVGASGANGNNGTTSPAGAYATYFIPGDQAENGDDGAGGAGGSGGGAGGGQYDNVCAVDGAGGGGGGGGGGGEGGAGGEGGYGGGGTFGVFIYNGTGSITDVQVTVGAGGAGGSGGLGGEGGPGGSSGSGGVNACGNDEVGDGNGGGDGGDGGDGGGGANGANGDNHQIYDNIAGSIVGGGVANPVTMTVDYQNISACTFSEIEISNSSGSWTSIGGAFVNDLSATTSSYNTSSSPALVYFNSAGTYDLGAGGGVYNNYVNITTTRDTPNITGTIPNDICINETITLQTPTAGDEYEWLIYRPGDGPGSPTYSSSAQNPGVVGPFSPAGNYIVRLRIRTTCCGWSIPTFRTFTIRALPNVQITGLSAEYCIDAVADNLTGTPGGGTFSGPGMSGSTFTPSSAGMGTHEIIYAYTDGFGCSNSDTETVVVNALPSVSFSGFSSTYCEGEPVAPLTGSPSGGIYTGTGIVGNTFDPVTAGVGGPYNITYTYSDGNGCTDSETQSTTVNPLPNPTFSGLLTQYCENEDEADLVGTPSGGVFSGPGVTGTTFDPGDAGAGGPFKITYTYTNPLTSCTDSFSRFVTVRPLPTLGIVGLDATYCIDDLTDTIFGLPPGGTFSGTGMTSNYFSPSTAGIGGPYTITYTFTDAFSCTNSLSLMVTVNDTPSVSFSGLAPEYCEDEPAVSLTGFPNGGTFSGPGAIGPTFTPSLAGVGGPHTITYSYTNANGCSNSLSRTTTINPLPVATFTGLNSGYCISKGNVFLTGSPPGGTFSGPGIISGSNVFNTDSAGVGGPYTIRYSYTDGNGCSDDFTRTVTVYDLPVVSINGLAPAYCENISVVPLSGTPSGGVFSGLGVSGSVFIPSIPGPGGPYTITYTYTDGTNCQSSTTAQVTVNPQPVVFFTGLNAQYCEDAGTATLTGTPPGGSFTGPGMLANVFNPALSGAGGPYDITYTYTDGNGCSNSQTQQVTVNPLPVVTLGGLASGQYCENSLAITMIGTPPGGTYSGTGVVNNFFLPSVAGPGTYNLTYTYTTAAGCTNSDVQSVTVTALPSVSFAGLETSYCVDEPIESLFGSPPGGNFSGTGISGSTFSPAAAGVGGPFTITYTYTDNNNCTNSDAQPTTVYGLPSVTFTGIDSTLCINDGIRNLTGIPSGGTFTGVGVSGNTFNPRVAGVGGPYNITYSYTDGNSCSQSVTKTITVYEQPPSNITPLGPTTFCSPSTVTLQAPTGNGYSYTWLKNGSGIGLNNSQLVVDESGSYEVIVTSVYGCDSTSNPVNITVNELDITAQVINGALGCNNSFDGVATVVINTGLPPYTINWSGGTPNATDDTVTNLSVGSYTVTVTDGNNCTKTKNFSITSPTSMILSVSSQNITCFGATNGSAIVSVSGGAGGYSYAWSTNPVQNTPVATNLGAGSYDISVTDANNCLAVATVVISGPPQLVLNTGTSPADCFSGTNGSASVSVTGGNDPYTYTWNTSPPRSTPSINGLSPGSYTVIVRDSNNCTKNATVVVGTIGNFAANVTAKDVACFGSTNGQVSVSLQGGTSPFTYAWDNDPRTGATLNNLTPDTYTVTVTDDVGCTGVGTGTVGEPSDLLLALTSTPADCFVGNNGTAGVNVTGGSSPYTYQWNTNPFQFTATATNVAPGDYIVTVTDTNNCVKSDTVTVGFVGSFITNLTTSRVSCNGLNDGSVTVTTQGGSTPFTYAWDNDPRTTATINNITAGPYSVTVTDDYGCTSTANGNVGQPTPIILSPSSTAADCFIGNDGTASVIVSGGVGNYQFNWNTNPSQNTQSATGLPPGIYNVLVTDSNGCEADTSVTVGSVGTFIVNVNTESVSCFGEDDGAAEAVVTGGSGNYSYLWSSGGTSPFVNNLDPGLYTVTVEDNQGCSIVSNGTVGQPQTLRLNVTSSPSDCFVGNSGTATVNPTGGTAPFTYQWTTNPVQQVASATGLPPGSYRVFVTDTNGCEADTMVNVGITGVLNVDVLAQSISCNGEVDGVVQAVVQGSNNLQYSWNTPNNDVSALVSGLPKGTYTVMVNDPATGCAGQDSGQVFEPQPMAIDFINIDSVNCGSGSDGQIQVAVSGGAGSPYNYLWGGTNASGPVASGLSTGPYSVSITDTNGCQISANVQVGARGALVLNPDSTPESCDGSKDGTATVRVPNGALPITYQWSTTNLNSATITGLAKGSYNVTVIDDNGCEGATTVMVNQRAPLGIDFNVPNDTTLQPYDEIVLRAEPTFSGDFDYFWSFNPPLTLATESEFSSPYQGHDSLALIAPSATRTYIVEIREPRIKCGATDTVRIKVGNDYLIPSIFTPNGDELNNTFFDFDNSIRSDVDVLEMKIYNRWGEVVFETTGPFPEQWDGTRSGEPLPAGMYVYTLLLRRNTGDEFGVQGNITLIR